LGIAVYGAYLPSSNKSAPPVMPATVDTPQLCNHERRCSVQTSPAAIVAQAESR
jgi:hypothetical protein